MTFFLFVIAKLLLTVCVHSPYIWIVTASSDQWEHNITFSENPWAKARGQKTILFIVFNNFLQLLILLLYIFWSSIFSFLVYTRIWVLQFVVSPQPWLWFAIYFRAFWVLFSPIWDLLTPNFSQKVKKIYYKMPLPIWWLIGTYVI